MFKWFRKDSTEKLMKQYEAKLSEAMIAQRNGDIRSYSSLSQEADDIYQKIKPILDHSRV